MKKWAYILSAMMLLLVAGCKKHNIISDDTLADIFHDAFVVNAYIGEERINLDSLQIYESIFARYGYTTEDVVYTIGNFSQRKSARLGNVVEQAISRLERESREYEKRVVILDTIRSVAVRSFTRTMYEDSLIWTKKRADTTKLMVEISPIQSGEYIITYNYKMEVDADKYPRRAEFYFEDEDGFRNGYASLSLRNIGNVNRTLVSKHKNHKLVLNLGKLLPIESKSKRGKRRMSKREREMLHNLVIRNLKVTYKPQEGAAIDSLFERYVNIKIFADGFLIKADSLTLSPDSTRVSTPTTHND